MNLDEIQVRAESPYPKIYGATEDNMTVAILKNLTSSRTGELSGILQYTFQSVIAEKTNEDIASIFEEIAIVEMMHLNLLSHAITEFGGVPRFEDSQGSAYTTNNVNYTTKLKDMLEYNIRLETKSIESYNEAIAKLKNESLKALISRIIEDEEKHLNAFKHMRDSVQFLSV